MSAVSDVAAAILDLAPHPERFPALGVLQRVSVYRGEKGTGPITGIGLLVRVDDVSYSCGWSGAFAAEIEATASSATVDDAFVGRQVKVESIGGLMIVAFTVNKGN